MRRELDGDAAEPSAGTLGRYQRDVLSLVDPSLDVPTIAWISAPALQALACNKYAPIVMLDIRLKRFKGSS